MNKNSGTIRLTKDCDVRLFSVITGQVILSSWVNSGKLLKLFNYLVETSMRDRAWGGVEP